MSARPATRSRLEAQGYVGVAERSLADIEFGLRFSPALCALGVAIGTALASPVAILVMMATAAVGAATPRHPFDWLYNYAVRHLFGKPTIPRNGAPRRFSCAVGAVWLAATAAAFAAGWTIPGYVLGAGMAGMAAFVAVTHICLPSLVYTRLFDRVGDVPEVSVEEAFRRMKDGGIVVDVRDPELWAAGHAPGALHIPAAQLAGSTAAIDHQTTVLVVCQGGVTSLKAARLLREAGFPAACSVKGGMSRWLHRGLPVVQDRAPS